jgi:hypothetical protein
MFVELEGVYLQSKVFRNLHKGISAHHPHLRCPSICTKDLWQRKIGIDSEVSRIVRTSYIINEDRRPISNIDDYDLLIGLPFDIGDCKANSVDSEV